MSIDHLYVFTGELFRSRSEKVFLFISSAFFVSLKESCIIVSFVGRRVILHNVLCTYYKEKAQY